jgi:hypothetical protein
VVLLFVMLVFAPMEWLWAGDGLMVDHRTLTVADFNVANAVVEATHRHKEIFYDE